VATCALTIHRDYACRHSGACCTAGWPIPVERATVDAVTAAIARSAFAIRGAGLLGRSQGILTRSPARLFVAPLQDGDGALPLLARTEDGACVFFERDHGRLCAIHRQLGHDALPGACRQFPRMTLSDARGSFVSLSHYCPTAAGLLFRADTRLGIEHDPPAFRGSTCEGLDARDVLPPLLRPGVLHSLASYGTWERFQVEALADEGQSAEGALATIARAAEQARTWTLPLGPLEDHIGRVAADALENPLRGAAGACPAGAPSLARDVWASIPAPIEAPGEVPHFESSWARLAAPAWPALTRPVRHYLAARAFASWLAYQGAGVRTAVHGLRATLALLQVECVRACVAGHRPLDEGVLLEAMRAADLALVHLAAPDELTRRLARLEDVPVWNGNP
jgi:Fe-S-cluster containining protein